MRSLRAPGCPVRDIAHIPERRAAPELWIVRGGLEQNPSKGFPEIPSGREVIAILVNLTDLVICCLLTSNLLV